MPNITTNHAVTYTNLTCVNKIEAMYEVSRVSVKVERSSTFTFMRDLSYIASTSLVEIHPG